MIILKLLSWLFWIGGLVRKLQAGVRLKSILCILGVRISSLWRAGYPRIYANRIHRFQLSHTSPGQKKNQRSIEHLMSPQGVWFYSHVGNPPILQVSFREKRPRKKNRANTFSSKLRKMFYTLVSMIWTSQSLPVLLYVRDIDGVSLN